MTDQLTALIARLRELEAACPHIDPHPRETEYDFGSQYFNTSDDYAGYCVRKNLSDVGDKLRNALPALLSAIEAQAAEVARLREAIFWACGAHGDFPGSGDPSKGKFFWRSELRQRAGITGEELNARAALATDPRSELAMKGDA